MKLFKTDFQLLRVVFLLAIVGGSMGAWAVPSVCTYNRSGTGMGGTGLQTADEASQMQPAGTVVFSRGTVEAQSKGRSRLLTKGQKVCVGETIITSESGMAQIRMLDTGLISVRSDTKLRIDAFQFGGKEVSEEKSALYLIQGAFRALTGLIGHHNKENYKIETPTATIGIRGTDHEPMFIPVPAPGQVALGAPGTYDKVNSGGVYIMTPTGSVDVNPNQVGFAPIESNMPPLILKEIPNFYHVETGAESKSDSSGSPGNHGAAKDIPDRSARSEHTSTPGAHAPVIHVPGVHTSAAHSVDVHVPENQSPENRTTDAQAPATQTSATQSSAVQAPAVQAPAVQAPAVQAPAVQAPAVQAPAMEVPQH